jgi:predicted DNA-binding transcriptional regulator AlpA
MAIEHRVNEAILASWQEIAKYVGRGTRTLQRWEHSFGMPVHRTKDKGKREIVAFSHEIDRWLRSKPSSRVGFQKKVARLPGGSSLKDHETAFLNSWKEVAQFVGLGVRTVQRLEAYSDFPVHRPAGKLRSPIVAIPTEIREWLNKQHSASSFSKIESVH